MKNNLLFYCLGTILLYLVIVATKKRTIEGTLNNSNGDSSKVEQQSTHKTTEPKTENGRLNYNGGTII